MKNSDLKRIYGKDNMPNEDGFVRLNDKGLIDTPIDSSSIVPPATIPEGKIMASDGDGGTKWVDAVSGTEVIANPTLAGTERDLTVLQVGDTKYKVPSGGGESSIMFVDCGSSNTLPSGVTFSDIQNALLTKPVFLRRLDGEKSVIYQLSAVRGYLVLFGHVLLSASNEPYTHLVTLNTSGSLSFTSFHLQKATYCHHILLKNTTQNLVFLKIINNSETPFTTATVYNYLRDNGFTTIEHGYGVSGQHESAPVMSIYATNDANTFGVYSPNTETTMTLSLSRDNVIAL